jgi:hypothetical protein
MGNKRSTKKKRGRPATGQDPVTAIRLSAGLLEAVNSWQRHLYPEASRSEFIRWLIDEALLSLARKESARQGAMTKLSLTLSNGGPFTAQKESAMTKLIKGGGLVEGHCHLPWGEYFAFREKNDCEALTKADREYAGAYSSCKVPGR